MPPRRASISSAARRRRAALLPSGSALGALVGVLGAAGEVWAHGAPLDRRVGWGDFQRDPVVAIALAALAWWYARGWFALRRRAVAPRWLAPARGMAFGAGLVVLALALLSPLDPLGEQLAWAHMVQHMLLMTVAAPLMALGAPLQVCLWGLTPDQRRVYAAARHRLDRWRFPWRLGWQPLLATLLYAAALWIWHLPTLYQAALRSLVMHDLQHLTFFLAACLFWRMLLDPVSRHRIGAGPAVLCLFATTMHSTVLGVFMTVAPTPWYADYIGRAELWGLSALEDQQLAGLIMWMPGCAAYLLAAVALLAKTLAPRGGRSGILPPAPAAPHPLGAR